MFEWLGNLFGGGGNSGTKTYTASNPMTQAEANAFYADKPVGQNAIGNGGYLVGGDTMVAKNDGPGWQARQAAIEQAQAPAPAAPAAPTVDRSNSIALQNAGLEGAEQQRVRGVQAVKDALANLLGKYGTEAGANEANYNTQTETNKLNLQRQMQAAMVAAAQGRRGLFGTLAGLGALSGDGIRLATNAVQQGANADISGANDTFGENQTTLDTAIGSFRSSDEARRKDAELAARNAETGVENQAATNKQKFYSNLADDYTQMGNTSEAARYAALAAALFPQIAQTSVPSSSNIAYTGAAYTPATLANYLAGAGDTTVTTTPSAGGQLPSLVAMNRRRQRELPGV